MSTSPATSPSPTVNPLQLRRLLILVLPLALPGLASAAERPPNIVFILADDLGFGDVGYNGATHVRTPNIDRLAAEGRRFTDAHSTSAVCTPSRYALLTGEYPVRGNGGKGIWGPHSPVGPLLIDTETLTIGKALQRVGYRTACIGKWHLGFGKEGPTDYSKPLRPGPLEVGFDRYFGIPLVNSGSPFVLVEGDTIVGHDPEDPLVLVRKGRKPSPTPTYPPEAGNKGGNRFSGALAAHKLFDDTKLATQFTEEAVEWIGENRDNPFFLYLPTTNIHHPFTPAPRFKGTSECGLYGDFIHELDWMVGEVMGALDQHGLADNTLVIFTSDNGGMINRGGQDAFKAGHRINGDLLGFKFGIWEGGHRVPFVARWPGQIEPGSTSDQLISHVDMLATLLALTGQEDKADLEGKDSHNMLPAFLGDPEEPIREELVLAPHKATHLSLRQGRWIYIPARGAGGWSGPTPRHAWGGPAAVDYVGGENSDFEDGKYLPDAPPAQLYDLEADLNQTTNLYREHPEIVSEMEARLKTFRPEKAAPKPKPRRPGRNQNPPAQTQPDPTPKAAKPSPAPRTVAAAGSTTKPNILLILTDDLGYSDVSCYGAKKVETPHLDALAAGGLRFTDFHTGANICSPSRAAFLTGAYPQRCGTYMGLNQNREAHWFLGLHPDEITVAEQCKTQGYQTFLVGKWHLGKEERFSFFHQGFDHYFGAPDNFGHGESFYDGRERMPQIPLTQLTARYAERVIDDIERAGDQPFFHYFAHNYPHTPFKPGPDFAGSSKGGVRGDVIQELDWGIGQVVQHLEDSGKLENTLIIFTSDNGPLSPEFAAPYRGTKYTTFEGGHRVPFILHWPARITEPSTVETPVTAMDLFPTISEIVGAPLPDDRTYDGVSLVPLLDGEDGIDRPADTPFYYYNCENLQAVRLGNWKLHLPRTPQQLPFWQSKKGFTKLDQPVLYNLAADPAESKDVAAAHPEVVQNLVALAEKTRPLLGEYMERGSEQRPTGSLFPEVPVISHSRDWEKLSREERGRGHSEFKGGRKTRKRQ